MSQGAPMPHAEALAIAEGLVNDLRPACERIQIAGSLRRGKPQVRDIEIVAIASSGTRSIGLGLECETYDILDSILADLQAVGALRPRPVENHRADGSIDIQYKLGPAFKALRTGTDVPVDLFIVRPPASWGVIFGLRTGPGDWNTRLVDECKSIGRRVTGGQVERWNGGRWEVVPTPEERDFFSALGQVVSVTPFLHSLQVGGLFVGGHGSADVVHPTSARRRERA